MLRKVAVIALMIFKIVMVIVGILFWSIGLMMFLDMKADGSGIGGWFFWGFTSCCALPFEVIGMLFRSVREGAEAGSKQFFINSYGGISDGTFRGMATGCITSIAASLLIGPILLPIKTLAHVLTIITCIMQLREMNHANRP